MTLSLAISKNAEEICSQNSVEEQMVSLLATATKVSFSPSISLDNKLAFALPSMDKLQDDTPSSSGKRNKSSKNQSVKPIKNKPIKDKIPSQSEILILRIYYLSLPFTQKSYTNFSGSKTSNYS